MPTPQCDLKILPGHDKVRCLWDLGCHRTFPASLVTPAIPVFFRQKPAFSVRESQRTKFGLHQWGWSLRRARGVCRLPSDGVHAGPL